MVVIVCFFWVGFWVCCFGLALVDSDVGLGGFGLLIGLWVAL